MLRAGRPLMLELAAIQDGCYVGSQDYPHIDSAATRYLRLYFAKWLEDLSLASSTIPGQIPGLVMNDELISTSPSMS